MTKVWKLTSPSPYAPQLSKETGITVLQAQLLINRGISDRPSAISFLTPRLANLIDPMRLIDMEKALELILAAIEGRRKITVYGDFDADGLTATALLFHFFSNIGVPVSYYIPDRLKEGYGLNPEALQKIAKMGSDLIITVDCGSANIKEIGLATQLGIEVVVTDHHQVPEDFEPICPVINPHRKDSAFPFKGLAGVGLSFFLAIALRAALRDRGRFNNRAEPDLKDFLDLVALGTVADMVPLHDQNRVLVKSGIERMKNSCWPGIRAMQEITDMDTSAISPYDLAFKLAPRLNAPGRMGKAELGIQALITDKMSIARDTARALNSINSKRQIIERDILDQIEEMIMSMEDLESRRTLVLSGNGWHKGVLGIVASKLTDIYHRPTLVMNIQDDMAMGSGRSIDGFNLHQALSRLGDLFERFGGHYHAAGFTLRAANVEALERELESLAGEALSDDDLIPTIEVDMEASISDITMETLSHINSLSPFGSGNPEPLFYAHSLEVIESRIVGERHLKLRVKQGQHVKEAIGFGLSEKHPLDGETIHMVYTPELNRWQGYEKIQLRIIDLEVMDEGSRPLCPSI